MRQAIHKVDQVDEHTVMVHLEDPDFHGKNSILQRIKNVSLYSLEELVVLSKDGATDSVITMGRSVQIMLKDIMPCVMESSTVARNRKLWVGTVLPDGRVDFELPERGDFVGDLDQHQIFFLSMNSPGVEMADQERYAIDLTHAQYGHHAETLMPWDTYVETRAYRISEVLPVGRAKIITEQYMLKTFGEGGRVTQGIIGQFENAMTAAVGEFSGWINVWKEPNEEAYQRSVEQTLQHVTTRLDEFIASKAKDKDFKLWHSLEQKKFMRAKARKMQKKKLRLWGEDFRGPAFVSAMEKMKARQAMERSKWGSDEDHKKKIVSQVVQSGLGTDYKGPLPEIKGLGSQEDARHRLAFTLALLGDLFISGHQNGRKG
ncbi:MAG: hypothetical protein Q9168_006666 [Polycauliona sp. 1 TL-2023]